MPIPARFFSLYSLTSSRNTSPNTTRRTPLPLYSVSNSSIPASYSRLEGSGGRIISRRGSPSDPAWRARSDRLTPCMLTRSNSPETVVINACMSYPPFSRTS